MTRGVMQRGQMRFSYCCGKPVERNVNERTGEKLKGYHCGRCKRLITVYGNPVTEADKQALKEKEKVKGRGHSIKSNGDMVLIGKVYPYIDAGKEEASKCLDYFVIMDKEFNYLTTINMEQMGGNRPENLQDLENRLKKEKLLGHRLSSFGSRGLSVQDLEDKGVFQRVLRELGYNV